MSNLLEIDECSICLEPLDNKFQIYILECRHQFHTTCLKEWYKNSKLGYNCPMCNEIKDIVNVSENSNEICSFVTKNSKIKIKKPNTINHIKNNIAQIRNKNNCIIL